MKISPEQYVLIEITEERSLQKVREDVNKLETARGTLFSGQQIISRCFCVVAAENITSAMLDAGKDRKIIVSSVRHFERRLFDLDSYKTARLRKQFGSAVNPVTGENDSSSYTPVTYLTEKTGSEISVDEIARLLIKGNTVVMTGEYGSGKSRCVRELFSRLCDSVNESGKVPIAIDLRENWGLKRAEEIVRRHFDDLGLNRHSSGALKLLGSEHLIFLLDGFDELGFQAWSDDTDRLKSIRKQSLEGVRDLIGKCGGSVFICGREHYFNNTEEMFSALSISDRSSTLIKSKDEFSENELAAYMADFSEDYVIPSWLPKRPLICQIIISLADDDLDRMFGQLGNDVEFWERFVRLLCKRDAQINPSFDADTIFALLASLARISRLKSANVGPISLGEMQRAFETVVGEMPIEQASVLVQRLTGLGRVKAESNDRQFKDIFILDGFRAYDLNHQVINADHSCEDISWKNPLEQLGQGVLARLIQESKTQKLYMQTANRCASLKNRVMSCDIIATLLRCGQREVDFGGLAIDGGHFAEVDMTSTTPINLKISNCTFSTLSLCAAVPNGTSISSSLAANILGVTSAKGLPAWAQVEADHYLAINNVATIRRLGLTPAQEILITIIRKTFFQKGAGRKEEALLRGLGAIGASGLANKVMNVLLREGLIERFKGNEGFVYTPKRVHADRMQKMLAELNTSNDPLWTQITELSKR